MPQNIMAATSALPSILVSGYVANSETTYYTCPAGSSTKLSSATVCNTSGSAATISISLVKAAGTPGVSNRVCSFSLAAGDSARLDEMTDAFLGPGDNISAMAGASTSITLVISGVVFS